MFLHLSVILFRGVYTPLDRHPQADTPPGHPQADTPFPQADIPQADILQADIPPRQIGTEADGTHPTGMHSSCKVSKEQSHAFVVVGENYY